MWVSRDMFLTFCRVQNELERRVKRLELMLYNDAQNKIASLGDEEAGLLSKDGFLTIEEIINKSGR